MEGLPDTLKEWSLEADRQLFAALQQFSASFLTRLKDTEESVANLSKDVEDACVRGGCLQTSFRQLANSHYIEQVRKNGTADTFVFFQQQPLLAGSQLTPLMPACRLWETQKKLYHSHSRFRRQTRQSS
jgi:hypothetical protein